MRTSSRPTALLLFPEVELLDVAIATTLLSMAGRKWNFRPFKIVPVASQPRIIETRSQVSLATPGPFSDCEAPEIVLVPGGYGARRALADGALVDWLGAAGGSAGSVVAMGHGTLLCAKAKLLQGSEVAVAPASSNELRELEPTCRARTDVPWCAAGRIGTSRTATGTALAVLHLIGKLLGEKHAAEISTELGLSEAGTAPVGTVEIIEPR